MSVEEIFYFDENDDERLCKTATDACIGIVTCADQGDDLWSWLRDQVEQRLLEAGISYAGLHFVDERGN